MVVTQTFGTNGNGDVYLGSDGDLVVLSGEAAVGAACVTAAKAQLGEMVLAVNLGIPNFQAVWNGTPNLAIFEAHFRKTVLAVDGVVSIERLTISVANNVMSYSATIKTVYGKAIPING